MTRRGAPAPRLASAAAPRERRWNAPPVRGCSRSGEGSPHPRRRHLALRALRCRRRVATVAAGGRDAASPARARRTGRHPAGALGRPGVDRASRLCGTCSPGQLLAHGLWRGGRLRLGGPARGHPHRGEVDGASPPDRRSTPGDLSRRVPRPGPARPPGVSLSSTTCASSAPGSPRTTRRWRAAPISNARTSSGSRRGWRAAAGSAAASR
jgi:hypothetical protein